MSYKSEGLERLLFLQMIKEKLTNLDKFLPLNYHKILNSSPPLSVPPTRISENIVPSNMSRLKSWSPPPLQRKGVGWVGGGGGEGGEETMDLFQNHAIERFI